MRTALITLIAIIYSTLSFAQDSYSSKLMDMTVTAPRGHHLILSTHYQDFDTTKPLLEERLICTDQYASKGFFLSIVDAVPQNQQDDVDIDVINFKAMLRFLEILEGRNYKRSKVKDEGRIDVEGKNMYKRYCKLSNLSPSGVPAQMEIYTYYDEKGALWSVGLVYANKFTKKPFYNAFADAIKTLK